ncbi:MAG TPA: nucleotidyltransferase family protein [Longimicrobiales bacterium]|nr:nucleotidyltransferase family protein [Longimicrobiales bacterium]
MASLSGEEQKSLTHGEFWIPEDERVVYRRALQVLNRNAIPYVVSGLYAIYEYTGIYRKTKDLDLFVEPGDVVAAARVLKQDGFTVSLAQAHWIAKAFRDEKQIDLIFGTGNGLSFIDAAWYRHSRAGILAGEAVRVAPPEEMLWHRLFVSERHRSDVADILHLILCRGNELDWRRLLERVRDDWRLLLGQVHLFDFVYPGHRERIPRWVRADLYRRAQQAIDETGDPDVCQGTLISRFSYNIDVNEWGFRDLRKEATVAARQLPIVAEITHSDVWDDTPRADDEASPEPEEGVEDGNPLE